MDVNKLSESFSMSTVRSKRRIRKIQSSNSIASLDRKILEAEAKVKSQIRQLASESFDDDDDDGYYKEYHDKK
jgi:ferritin